jgi:hypothetical protein
MTAARQFPGATAIPNSEKMTVQPKNSYAFILPGAGGNPGE